LIQVDAAAGIDDVMNWMNGLFDFQDKHLHEEMRQLGRWYDPDVVYVKDNPEIEFFGQIGRNLKSSDVLKVL
jgi:hypothetical protein